MATDMSASKKVIIISISSTIQPKAIRLGKTEIPIKAFAFMSLEMLHVLWYVGLIFYRFDPHIFIQILWRFRKTVYTVQYK